MLFEFVKYIHPIHYFFKVPFNDLSVFPDPDYISKDILKYCNKPHGYSSKISDDYDLSWQLIHKGLINFDAKLSLKNDVSLVDKYKFIAKYYKSQWLYYCLFVRIISFKNPFKEIQSFFRAQRIKKVNLYSSLISQGNKNDIASLKLVDKPFISVIIPTLNRYDYLHDALKDLENQDYPNFEVIIIDQSEPVNIEFYKNYSLDIKLIQQKEKALWRARNSGIRSARGDIIALYEDDVRVKEDWLSMHLKVMRFYDSDISAGVFFPQGSNIPLARSFCKIANQFATGNAILKKEIFKRIGLFDRQFEKGRSGDGEFGLRCHLAGYLSVSNPYAFCIDVKAPSGGLRQMGSWDSFRSKKLFAPKPVPSVLYFYRKYFGIQYTVFALLLSVPPSLVSYKFKRNKILKYLSFLLVLFLFPIVLFQIIRSWRLASQKLKEGALIENL